MNQPWETEPDYEKFETTNGLTAIINRNRFSQTLCGYVRVDENHWLFGEDYETADRMIDTYVHGGLTYSGDLKNISVGTPGSTGENSSTWFFGFDCAHYGDYIPTMPELGGQYCDIDYVRSEVENLATHLADTTN